MTYILTAEPWVTRQGWIDGTVTTHSCTEQDTLKISTSEMEVYVCFTQVRRFT